MTDDREINVDSLRRSSEKEREKWTDTEVGLIRRKAKTNLFFLSSTILGFDKLSLEGLHGNFCSWMDKTREDRFRLILMPRGHYKTTINSIADGIQIILPDDTGNQPFPRNLGPEARVLLAHEVEDTAKQNLSVITNKIYDQEFLVAFFPELVPGKNLRVNQTNLELPRKNAWPEATFTVLGRGAAGQGKHFDIMKINDIVGLNAMSSEADYKAAVQWVHDLGGMFTSMSKSHIDFEGVRYRKDDIYSLIMKDFGSDIKIYRRSVWERNDKNERVLIFPEETSWKDLERIKNADPALFYAQYLNNPMEIEGEFSQEWERYFEWNDNQHFEIVAPQLNGEIRKIDTRDMDILVMLDPAVTGFSGIAVTGTDKWGVTYILEAIQEKFNTDSLTNKIFSLVAKWNPRAVVVEKVNFSALYEPLFKKEMKARDLRFRMIMVTTKQKQKEDRVRVLRPWFSSGKIWFHLSQEGLVSQYRDFPSVIDYHILDVLAYGPEVWRSSDPRDRQWDKDEDMLEKFRNSRSTSTGYSSIKYA